MRREWAKYIGFGLAALTLETAVVMATKPYLFPAGASIEDVSKGPVSMNVAQLMEHQNEMIGRRVVLTGWPASPQQREIRVPGSKEKRYIDEYKFFQTLDHYGFEPPIFHVIIEGNYINANPDIDKYQYDGTMLEVTGTVMAVDPSGGRRDAYLLVEKPPEVVNYTKELKENNPSLVP